VMIRINLLPRSKKRLGSSANNQVWVAGYVAAALVLSGLFAFLHLSRRSELVELQRQNKVIQEQIAQERASVGDLKEVQAALERSRQLEEVVTGLLNARSGPARMLMELSNILTPGEGPSIDPEKLAELRRTNPSAGYTVGWDTRRLWLRSFSETSRKCAITGVGKNNEDVAEFLRRLEISDLFHDVSLRSTEAESGQTGLGFISFGLGCGVSY